MRQGEASTSLASVQGGPHHFPQIPLKILHLETQLHTHPNHSYFLVSLMQSLDLRDRRKLGCYLKSSVLSNFRAAAVPQVSCTKPCCVWTCEFSQKTNKCINEYFLTPLDYWIILPMDFQQLHLNLRMTMTIKVLAVAVT